MDKKHLIETGDAAGPLEIRSVTVDKVLSEISRLYLTRVQALQSGDREAFLEIDQKIASLKETLSKL